MAQTEIDPRMPVLVGAGQCVQRKGEAEEKLRSPLAMMAEASRLAARDCGLGEALFSQLDTIAVVRFVSDAPDALAPPFVRYPNPPLTLANMVGAGPRALYYGPTGGNSPQYLINCAAEWIAQGEADALLLSGAECLHSIVRALREGRELPWSDDPGGTRKDLGEERSGTTALEKSCRLHLPVNAYPLFENALRKSLNRSIPAHNRALGELMASFSRIAAGHAQAWFPTGRSVEEITSPGPGNRYVGFPYTKYMNAIMQVDQSAALVMMSAARAQELGVPREKWVFLHGCADVNDIWFLSERVNFHSSPAIRRMGQTAFQMAGWTIGEVEHLDIYSCFPSAVQIAREELGIPPGDRRTLTVTGGLPYFGGAGNNYTMHAVATMLDRLRRDPGSKGLCTANGWYLTKHAMGLYSTAPPQGPWRRRKPSADQAEIDGTPHPRAAASPQGGGKIEAYTVAHDREGPVAGLAVGRLDESGERFVAHTPADPAMFERLMTQEMIGCPGAVKPDGKGGFLFEPA